MIQSRKQVPLSASARKMIRCFQTDGTDCQISVGRAGSLPGLTPVGVLVSGGLDSSILLAHYVETGRPVVPFYVRSQLVWQEAELAATRRFLHLLAAPQLAPLVVLDLPLADLYGDHWSVTGRQAPGEETSDEAVYLPGRNPLLLIKPALWCAKHGVSELAVAHLAANPFADASREFFTAFEAMLNLATAGREDFQPIQITQPLAGLSKIEVLELGRNLPLGETFSCISPVRGQHCGVCNKCGERKAAFSASSLEDPTAYTDVRAQKALHPEPAAS